MLRGMEAPMLRLPCLVALAGCFGGNPPPAPAPDEAPTEQAPPAEDAAVEGSEASAESESEPEPEAPSSGEDGLVRADERAYATRWLVIVHKSRQEGTPFAGLEALERVENMDVSPARLYSSHLNGLRPCEYLVVASAYDRKEEARYFGHKLEQAGFEVDVRQAGAHAPLDSRLEKWCEASAEPVAAACPADLHFVLEHGGSRWIELGASQSAVEQALASAQEPLAVDPKDKGWWSTSVTLEEAEEESLKLGAVWQGLGKAEEPVKCRVKAFEVVVRGTPHHREEQEEAVPTCGEPRLFARIDCPEKLAWVVPEDAELPTRFAKVTDRELPPSALASAMVTLTSSDLYALLRKRARAVAEQERTLLEEATDVQMYRAGEGEEVLVVHGTISSGEEDEECGAAGVHSEIIGVVDSRGQVLTPFRELSGEVTGLVDLDSDGRPELLQNQWPGAPTLFAGNGAVTCRLPTEFCDSPCASGL